MELKLDPVALREATQQALMGVLTPEMRAEILRGAITAILTPVRPGYGDGGQTPLQAAFGAAIREIVLEQARIIIGETPQVVDKVRALVTRAIESMVDVDQEKLQRNVTDAIISSVKERIASRET